MSKRTTILDREWIDGTVMLAVLIAAAVAATLGAATFAISFYALG
jgi:hypothetical protein